MKRFLVVVAVLVCAASFAQELMQFQEGTRKRSVSRLTPMPVSEDANIGYLETMATDTFEVSTVAVQIPSLAPGTVQFSMIASGADVFFGPSDVTAGFDDFVPDGYARKYSCVSTLTPNIWFVVASGTAQMKIRCIGNDDL